MDKGMRKKNAAKAKRWREKQKQDMHAEKEVMSAAIMENENLQHERKELTNHLAMLNQAIFVAQEKKAQRETVQQSPQILTPQQSQTYRGSCWIATNQQNGFNLYAPAAMSSGLQPTSAYSFSDTLPNLPSFPANYLQVNMQASNNLHSSSNPIYASNMGVSSSQIRTGEPNGDFTN